ncbi:MAG: adenylosuccinate synthase [Phycisphaerae bacterium]|nr:adenylosuccinate synthase [Phycisphaerae bacterium]
MISRNVTVVGLQWGDEGKGKIVDALSDVCDYVARFCGGANAGHSVVIGDQKFALHLIPCGVFRPRVVNVIGNGVAFDPTVAVKELTALQGRGVEVGPGNLAISAAANVVMPYHKQQDSLSEASLGDGKIGTTSRGIGPCYGDKANRSTAIRVADLIDPDVLAPKIRTVAAIKNKIFAALYNAAPMDVEAIVAEYVELGRRIKPHVTNTGTMLRKAIAAGKRVLFEGGQGSLLDVDHGTFPFVTSSSVTSCGVPTGSGVSPADVGQVVGLIKAYSTRVGGGPFPTEQDNAIGNTIRERGREYGTTTGRPRRCGWFDAVAVRYTADLSGVAELSLSLLDVLSGLDEVKIAVRYRRGGAVVEDFDAASMDGVEPEYETLPGWSQDITACRRFEDLPPMARAYVDRVEQLVGRPVGFISVGPERTQTIHHHTKIEGLR